MRLTDSVTWPRIMLSGVILATWPVWRWYALRTVDGSDEPWGVLALVTLVALWLRNGCRVPADPRRLTLATIALAIYALTYRNLSPLPRAVVVAVLFGLLCFDPRTALAQAGLLSLSLPIIASVQFYLGYPLRIIAAQACVVVLNAFNLTVVREGSLLCWRGETIMVDAPCSGIRMLWVGLYLAATLAVWSRLNNRRCLVLFPATLILVIAANVLRALGLFFKESGIVTLPHWTHVGLGALIFSVSAVVIMRLARQTEDKRCRV